MLRPTFTRHIIQALQNGTAINLVGSDEMGRTRLLEDVVVHKPRGRVVLLVNIRTCVQDYAVFIRALCQQMEFDSEAITTLAAWVQVVEQDERKLILLLNEFDALLDNLELDPAFNM